MIQPDASAQLRLGVYAVLAAVATGGMLGRILAVNSVDQVAVEGHFIRQGRSDWQRQRPFLSANDRSRWATVRALVEHGTYAIDEVVSEPGWDTIDMVKHQGRDGQDHLYSSKPPLLATLLAAEYWLIHRATGATLGDFPYEIGRTLLIFNNLLPMLAYFAMIAVLIERFGATDWGRIFTMTAATLGTFLTTFVVVINNHTPAAICAAIALWASARIWCDGERRLRFLALAGLFAALTVANELPALALFAALAVGLTWKAPREAMLGFLPASLLVAAAAVGTNYAAHDSLRPPYMHRSQTDPADNWYDYSYERDGKTHDSYWRNPQGIDRGEPSPWAYGLHVTVGHHGIFSLTPVWILSVWGVAILWRDPRTRAWALLIASVSLACLAFYVSRPQIDRNYGGMTSGLRWMFWFAPMWLIALVPAADRLAGSRAGRGIALLLLTFSVMSASYPTWNPWTQPWLWNFLEYLGVRS